MIISTDSPGDFTVEEWLASFKKCRVYMWTHIRYLFGNERDSEANGWFNIVLTFKGPELPDWCPDITSPKDLEDFILYLISTDFPDKESPEVPER